MALETVTMILSLTCTSPTETQALNRSNLGPWYGPVFLENVVCNGTESYGFQCNSSGPGVITNSECYNPNRTAGARCIASECIEHKGLIKKEFILQSCKMSLLAIKMMPFIDINGMCSLKRLMEVCFLLSMKLCQLRRVCNVYSDDRYNRTCLCQTYKLPEVGGDFHR